MLCMVYVYMSEIFHLPSILSIFFNRGHILIAQYTVAITHRHHRNVYVNVIRFIYFISGSMAFVRSLIE